MLCVNKWMIVIIHFWGLYLTVDIKFDYFFLWRVSDRSEPQPLRLPSERLEAKPYRDSPKIGSPSPRLFLPLPRAVSLPSLSSPRLLPSSLSSPRAAASGGGGRLGPQLSLLSPLISDPDPDLG
ncbi:hypothetical protein DY000_02062510 [Brassica cretica]|uniref:Uncharacterized protein n=1 Tax=Brassica cretica TaxID=69181 RepID=A0ABQ7AYV3_BRACR|nr:hypothetical protein DY000_02062510 [Brassica cretica]